MLNNIYKHKIAVLAIVAVIFGLGGGIVGEILARAYLARDIFNVPFFGELNFGNSLGGPSLIIRDAKKVVVEQNTQISEVASDVKSSLAGIFPKKKAVIPDKNATTTAMKTLNADSYYQLDKEAGQGFIITSDGWLITDYLPAAMSVATMKSADAAKLKNEILAGYIVITSDRSIYSVDNLIYDNVSGYSFWHIAARDLKVKSFASHDDIKSGATVLALNWDGWVWPASITAIIDTTSELPESSDSCREELVLDSKPSENFKNSFLFSLSGELVGLIGNEGKIQPIFNFTSAINSLLKNKTIARAKLGVNYINLAIAVSGAVADSKGALISKDKSGTAILKNSAAEKAGLQEGDIILTVNGVEIGADNDLCELVGKYSAGDEILLTYSRGEIIKEIKIKL